MAPFTVFKPGEREGFISANMKTLYRHTHTRQDTHFPEAALTVITDPREIRGAKENKPTLH